MKRTAVLLIILTTLFLIAGNLSAQFYKLPKKTAPHLYGNLLINRLSEKNGMKPVSFSHWSHRRQFTCRVCHFELEFAFKANSTDISEKDNKAGRYCGACHNGKIAFGHTDDNCMKCHNGDIGANKDSFAELKNLPKSEFGNKVDWAKAITKGDIKPRSFLLFDDKNQNFDKNLILEAEMVMVSPAIFPHQMHTKWLDCGNCHPDIFNVKKKTTKHFSMDLILKGEFCGTCHLKVAFPIDDCYRCHFERAK